MMLGSGYEYLFGALRPPPEKYTRSTLARSAADEIAMRAQAIMDTEQLFLDPDLRLDALASRLAVSRYHVSQSLNQVLGKSFNEFVNAYRVRALKTRMSDPATAQSPMLQLAFEAGFGTKATFNSAFKKATGLTPSEYRALQQEPGQPDQ
jgi:AraC-like DNA-binding protein